MPLVWPWQRRRGAGGERGLIPPPPVPAPADRPRPVPLESGADPTAPSGPRRSLVTPDVSGTTPDGRPAVLRLDEVGGPVVLAFLTTDCDGCRVFWTALGGSGAVAVEGRAPVPAVIVTRGPRAVPPDEVRALGGGIRVREGSPVPLLVMSDSAWTDYGVLGYPFFVLVDAEERAVLGETVGFGWPDLVTMVSRTLHPR